MTAQSDDSTVTKMEFAVHMTCSSCVSDIEKTLKEVEGIKSFSVNLQDEQVVVESMLPSGLIHEILENTGRKAILRGHGTIPANDSKHLGAAVAIITENKYNIQGVIRFVQADENKCVIDGTLDGLMPGFHGLHIHELGDITDGCNTVGNHFNPNKTDHGGPMDEDKHCGDLGNIAATETSRAQFRLEVDQVKVWDIIGRSIVVTEDKDDLGRGSNQQSKIDGNSGKRLACGIIARSAGLFQNTKKVCACTGKTLWQEREQLSSQL